MKIKKFKVEKTIQEESERMWNDKYCGSFTEIAKIKFKINEIIDEYEKKRY